MQTILNNAKRIPTSDEWFEVIKLPNNVYAFSEPGHGEHVSSFLIIGEKKDLLFDTGMGIASIKNAVDEVRKAEGLPERELMVVISHGHLDHIGSAHEFDTVYTYGSDWGVRKLTEGLTANGNDVWVNYYSDLTGAPKPPKNFSPQTMSFPPMPKDSIRFINDGETIDLGNRSFTAFLSLSHSDDSLVLYDAHNKLLFTGDVFVPRVFYVRNYEELHKDLKMLQKLDVTHHYNTHGKQLADIEARNKVLKALEKVLRKEVPPTQVEIFGELREQHLVDGITFLKLGDFLLY